MGPVGRLFLSMVAFWSSFMALALSCLGQAAESLQSHVFEKPQMGVPFRLVIRTEQGPDFAAAAASQTWSRIEALNQAFSNYQTDTELSLLGQGSGRGLWVAVSPDLWDLMIRSQRLAYLSDGAFDLTMGPLTALWRKSRREQSMPDAEELARARAKSGWQHLLMMPEAHSVCLTQSGMRLDPGGIAKGYALDAGIEVLKGMGVQHALLSGGGDMMSLGGRSLSEPWQIRLASLVEDEDVNETEDLIPLQDMAMATSGDLFQFVEIDGKRYSHILNPSTGMGLTTRSLVTVVASDAITADAVATTLSVLGPIEGRKWVKRHDPDLKVRFLWMNNEDQVQGYDTFLD